MTPEQLLLSGIGAVTGALVFVGKILWKKVDECEADRRELRVEIVKVREHQLGYIQSNAEVLARTLQTNTDALHSNTAAMSSFRCNAAPAK